MNKHISQINVGDIVIHNGEEKTIGKNDLKSGFMGITLFGGSYRLGTIPVTFIRYFCDSVEI